MNKTQTHPWRVTPQIQADIMSAAYYDGITYWAPASRLAPGETRPSVEEKQAALPEDNLNDTVYASDFVALGRTVMLLVVDFTWEEGYTAQVVEGLEPEHVTMAEASEGVWLRLSQEDLKRGIRKAAEHYKVTIEGFHDNHDATWADVAVQFALFGKIIFG